MHYASVVKSQTLSTKKLRTLLKSKNEFHLDTKNQLMICKKILFLTGALGFAGKHYYNHYKNEWDKIIVFDKKTYAADQKFFFEM